MQAVNYHQHHFLVASAYSIVNKLTFYHPNGANLGLAEVKDALVMTGGNTAPKVFGLWNLKARY